MDEDPNADINSNLMLLHCRTLERLLGVLPRPSPPQNEILNVLRTNVQLFAAFIEQDVQNLTNVNKSGKKKRKSRTEKLDSTAEIKTTNHKKRSEPTKVADNPPVPLMDLCVTLPSGVQPPSLRLRRPKKAKSKPAVPKLPAALEAIPEAVIYERDDPPTQMEFFAQAYSNMLKLDPTTLSPFSPTNRYPKGFVMAIYKFPDGRSSNGLFVGNVLMLGDAFVYGIDRLISGRKSYRADDALCNKILSISQLTEALEKYPRLPQNVLLSIGTTDAGQSESLIKVRRQYGSLLQTLKSKGVTKLRVLPVMTFGGMSPRYEEMAAIVAADWSILFEGEYIYEKDLLQPLLDSFEQPLKFEDNFLLLLPKQWRQIADSIRSKFDPSFSASAVPSSSAMESVAGTESKLCGDDG